ncbi:ATP-binding protein [Citricoccus sp. NPDC079358]|uniref:HAMP domain-containing sensor histidine kinase n=1 Tax=Citricoccus sp. NPDC079358 TaxID=3154653 RepID=UPI00344D5B3A
MSRRHGHGLASRFLAAQLLVVAVSLLVALVVAVVAGPPIFHTHLLMAGRSEGSAALLHAEQAYRDANLIVLAVAVGTALVCALLISAWCARRIRRPLDQLSTAALAMAGGSYDTRVPPLEAGTEVDAVAGAFNTMASRLERTETTRRRMLSDLAHELRTPVSVLTVYVDALQDGVTSWDGPTAELMSGQLRRLGRLVEDIGDVSRTQEGHLVLDRTEVSVPGLLTEAVEPHREAFSAKGVTLAVDAGDGSGTVEVDRQRIGQVLGNLLTNALRHTPPGGTVTLRATGHRPGRLALVVADTGEGICAEHLPQIFERFYRGDTARDRDHGGSGIGLAIARALVEAHGGTLSAVSAGPGRGAVFTVDLPRPRDTHRRRVTHTLARYPQGVYTKKR